MRLKDKVAFITGAGVGQGRAACLLFAKEGAKIVAADVDKDSGEETVGKVKEQGGEAVFVSSDVAVEAQVKAAIEAGAALRAQYAAAGLRCLPAADQDHTRAGRGKLCGAGHGGILAPAHLHPLRRRHRPRGGGLPPAVSDSHRAPVLARSDDPRIQ